MDTLIHSVILPTYSKLISDKILCLTKKKQWRLSTRNCTYSTKLFRNTIDYFLNIKWPGERLYECKKNFVDDDGKPTYTVVTHLYPKPSNTIHIARNIRCIIQYRRDTQVAAFCFRTKETESVPVGFQTIPSRRPQIDRKFPPECCTDWRSRYFFRAHLPDSRRRVNCFATRRIRLRHMARSRSAGICRTYAGVARSTPCTCRCRTIGGTWW